MKHTFYIEIMNTFVRTVFYRSHKQLNIKICKTLITCCLKIPPEKNVLIRFNSFNDVRSLCFVYLHPPKRIPNAPFPSSYLMSMSKPFL
jgi:hypothetical protein